MFFFVFSFLNRTFEIKMSDEKTKEKAKEDGSGHINLKVLGQDNNAVQFKIKRNTALRKLMNAYCDRVGLSAQVVRFRYDGQAVHEDDTPIKLDMEDQDTIEAYGVQTGGTNN